MESKNQVIALWRYALALTPMLARQQRVLACARRAIGYARLTMKDLAHSSEVSVKALYNLFNSKHELLVAALAETLADLAEQPDDLQSGEQLLGKVFGPRDMPFVERLEFTDTSTWTCTTR